jgi:hypothetical protein
MEVEREDEKPKEKEIQPLVQIGAPRKKTEGFNTAQFGFKKMKKNTLSFN